MTQFNIPTSVSMRKPLFTCLKRAVAVLSVLCAMINLPLAAFANTELDVKNGQSDLTLAATYVQTATPTLSSDVTFLAATTYNPIVFTLASGSSLTAGTIDDLDGTQSLTIQNLTGATAATTLTLSGGSNSVAPSASDLLYVASGGTLTIQNNASTLGVTLAAAGNFDVVGTASISSIITMGSNAVTKTGAGTLTINAANAGSGGFTIAQGTVSTNNAAGLGGNGNAVSIGLANSANNAALQLTGNPSFPTEVFTIASGAGTRSIISTNGTAFGSNGVILGTGISVTLNHSLIVANTGVGSIQFRGVISESGGSYSLNVDSTNVGYIDLRGANTFSGGVAINAGYAVAGIGSAGSVGAVTSGAFGTGTVTLGGTASSAAATLVINGNYGVLNSLTVASGGTRTISETATNTTSGTYGGSVALNGDLTLSAVATVRTTGADAMRFGSAGVTGSNNVIINNANTATGAVASSAAIRFDGNGSATAWTGNLIIQAGQGALGTATATGANNTVGVTSGALFNLSDGSTFNSTIAGLANAASSALGGTTGGTVFGGANASVTLTLGGSGTYAFAGTIADGKTIVAANTAAITAITKSGAGTQTLSGNNTYSGVTTITSGTLKLGSTTALGTSALGASNTFTGTLDFNGYAITNAIADKAMGGATLTNTGAAADETGIGTIGATATRAFSFDGTGNMTFNQAINGGYSITKNGTNTVTLGGTNVLGVGGVATTTTVTNGTLLINGSTTNSAFTFSGSSGAKLGGSGTITAGVAASAVTVTSGNILQGGAGGSVSSSLTLNGAVTVNSGGVLEFAVNNSGSSSSLKSTGGTWTLNSGSLVYLDPVEPLTSTPDTCTLITGLSSDPGVANLALEQSYFQGSFAYSSGAVTLTLTTVPEPASLSLIGLASLSLLGRRRRRA